MEGATLFQSLAGTGSGGESAKESSRFTIPLRGLRSGPGPCVRFAKGGKKKKKKKSVQKYIEACEISAAKGEVAGAVGGFITTGPAGAAPGAGAGAVVGCVGGILEELL